MRKAAQFRSLVSCLVAAFLMVACGQSSRDAAAKEQVVAVAKQEALRQGWKAVEVDPVKDVREVEDHWQVLVWRVPGGFGDHAFVTVSRDFKVLSFEPGP